MVFEVFSEMYVFSGFPGVAVWFAQGVIRLLPAVFFFVSLLWLWVSAHRHEEGAGF
jgi:hypothetical protein